MPNVPKSSSPSAVRAWLAAGPSLDDLRAAFPAEWTAVEAELMAVVDTGDPAALTTYVQGLAKPAPVRAGARNSTASGLQPVVAATVRQRMAAEAIRGLSVRAATGVKSGSVRFGKVNGTIIQRLLFRDGLERKPVSNLAFRLLWPLLGERRRLMSLVQPQGIYCFYSAGLVRELAKLIGDRPALEIAAGDGTLTRFLAARGAQVTATDDHSWKDVSFPADVERLDARSALKAHAPKVVLCSWPPAANDFEAAVFRTPSVDTYIVIGNRQLAGWGDHLAYDAQAEFELRIDERLSRLVLPPELESVVYVFTRGRAD